jgi:hypothetical protein
VDLIVNQRAHSAVYRRLRAHLDNFDQWSFNCVRFCMSADFPLAQLTHHAITQRGLVSSLKLDSQRLAALLVQCELSYIDQ